MFEFISEHKKIFIICIVIVIAFVVYNKNQEVIVEQTKQTFSTIHDQIKRIKQKQSKNTGY